MNEAKRTYDILRGYINSEWDRIRGVNWDEAWKELSEPIQKGDPLKRVETMSPDVPSKAPEETAREILGVGTDADFDVIRKAFETLNKRSQPANFPPGSSEEETAKNLQMRIHWAYHLLTQSVSSSEKRFKSLEIE